MTHSTARSRPFRQAMASALAAWAVSTAGCKSMSHEDRVEAREDAALAGIGAGAAAASKIPPPSKWDNAIEGIKQSIATILPPARGSIGTTAADFLKVARTDRDPNRRFLAYGKLADLTAYTAPEQKDEAAKLLIERFDPRKGEPVASRAVICRTLGDLKSPLARELMIRAVDDPEPIIRVEACRGLGKVGQDQDATILARVMSVDSALLDCRVAAIDALGDLKPKDPRIPQVLAAGLLHDEPAIRYASLESLRKITGKDLGVDPAPWLKAYPPAGIAEARPASDSQAKAAALFTPPDPNKPAPAPKPGLTLPSAPRW